MSNTALIPEGTTKLIQTPEGIRFEKIEQPEATGHAYVATERATTKRDQEIEAGRKRVAEAAALAASRPPRDRSEAEIRAEGQNVPVIRPNMPSLDRLNTGLGPLMRRVGAKVQAPAVTE